LTTTFIQETDSLYLYPAGLHADNTPRIIHTILGSCVSVCLYDKVRKTGGINHYMLPLWNGNGLATPKFGNIAIERLIDNMIFNGSRNEHLAAKVFGGAAVLDSTLPSFHIGERNIEIAFEILRDRKIPIVAQSTGGRLGRKIVFNTHTGEVTQRYVKSSDHSL